MFKIEVNQHCTVSETRRESTSLSLPTFGDSWQSLAFLGLGMDHSTLLLFLHSLSPNMSESLHLCICLCLLISNKNTSHTGLGLSLLQ